MEKKLKKTFLPKSQLKRYFWYCSFVATRQIAYLKIRFQAEMLK